MKEATALESRLVIARSPEGFLDDVAISKPVRPSGLASSGRLPRCAPGGLFAMTGGKKQLPLNQAVIVSGVGGPGNRGKGVVGSNGCSKA